MAQNIVYKLLGVRKQALYAGESAFKIWKNENESISIKTDYNGVNLRSFSGSSKLTRYLLGAERKKLD